MSAGLTPRAAGVARDARGKKEMRIRIDAIAYDRRMVVLRRRFLGYVQETVLHEVVDRAVDRAIDPELSASRSLKP